jgi:hypothetical protein
MFTRVNNEIVLAKRCAPRWSQPTEVAVRATFDVRYLLQRRTLLWPLGTPECAVRPEAAKRFRPNAFKDYCRALARCVCLARQQTQDPGD